MIVTVHIDPQEMTKSARAIFLVKGRQELMRSKELFHKAVKNGSNQVCIKVDRNFDFAKIKIQLEQFNNPKIRLFCDTPEQIEKPAFTPIERILKVIKVLEREGPLDPQDKEELLPELKAAKDDLIVAKLAMRKLGTIISDKKGI